ncbi:MAG: aminopeptidase P family protein [Anaerolineae bacterium]|nr:aminopeptidase P family protein [Anaerolineae bacterium]
MVELSSKIFDALPRLAKLQAIIRQAGLDAAAFVPGPNIFYLTGVSFHLSERPTILIVPATGEAAMILPSLEMPKIVDAAPFPMRFFSYTDSEGAQPAFERACQGLNLSGQKLGVEGLRMRVLEGQLFARYASGCVVTAADDVLMKLRLHKDQDEIEAMRRAIALSQKALDATLAQIHPGMTERQIVNILLMALSEQGSDGNAFEPIVLSGPGTAHPHGMTGDRPIRAGELLLFDFGGTYHGYPADITRTFGVGALDPELVTIYETVKAANAAGVAAAKPGVAAQEVDRAARRVITDAGYGEYFIHRTGHGLGLDIHEGPYMTGDNTLILEPGMVFTVEPGIYVPGKGGVRVEDNVVITATGADVLTTYPRELRIIGQ